MRRNFITSALLNLSLSSIGLASSTPSPDAQWQAVQNLKSGSSIRVTTVTGKHDCDFRSADINSLVCTQNKEDITFTRPEIRSIVAGHRGRSALTGALLGGAVGAGIGAGTDFTHKTIYKTP